MVNNYTVFRDAKIGLNEFLPSATGESNSDKNCGKGKAKNSVCT